MSAFGDVVARARTMVKGIDWDKLESEGRGIPLDPNVDAHLGYWVDYLGPAFNRAADAMNTLYYDPVIVNTASTQDAMNYMYRLLQDLSPQAQAYMRLNQPSLMFSPIPLPVEDFRLMISYVWGVIMYGTRLHTTFAITAMSRATWRKHAENIVMLCEALSMLDSMGALNRLKWDSQEMVDLRNRQGVPSLKPFTGPLPALSGPDGLGSPIVVGAGVLVAAVAAVVLIYGIYEWSSTTTEINKQTLDKTAALCSDPNYANDAATKEQCVKVLGDALAKSTMVKLPGSEIITYVLLAAGLAATIWFAPTIVRSFRGVAAEARKPATA